MTNINPSPILNDFLTRRASAPQQTEIAQTPEKPEGKKKINKALIGAAAAAGAAAIAFAGISMLRKGKMHEEVQKVVQSAEEFVQKANNTAEEVETISKKVDSLIDESVSPIVEEVKKISEEIRSIFEKGAENGYQDVVDENGILLRRFEFRNGIPRRLIEYGENGGPVIRETMIDSLKDLNFAVHDKVNNKNIDFVKGKPSFYGEGLEKMPDGTERRAKGLSFYVDGKPARYNECLEKMPDGTERRAKELWFEYGNGKPERYFEGLEELPDDTIRRAKGLWFNSDGIPSYYNEGLEKLPDGTIRRAKEFFFEDGKPSEYYEGVEELPDDTQKIAKALDFENGSPSYAEGVKIHFRDGDITTTEKSSIKLINGKWVKQN